MVGSPRRLQLRRVVGPGSRLRPYLRAGADNDPCQEDGKGDSRHLGGGVSVPLRATDQRPRLVEKFLGQRVSCCAGTERYGLYALQDRGFGSILAGQLQQLPQRRQDVGSGGARRPRPCARRPGRHAAAKGLPREVSVALAEGPAATGRPAVDLDKQIFRHALDNLVDNAIKYAQRDTPLSVELAICEAPVGWVGLEVRDTGRGIDP
ncbi:MAG TPA: ATP-binding protein, partial [Acidobacteria bacterium]|nr:ATP-binding protein [Acidobacteriota bacterium]